jgi:GAF domain-containing protein
MPKDATRTRRIGTYHTDAFISYPVQNGAQMLGVLNVSDRNDGGAFSADDEIAVAEVATKLAIVLMRLGTTHLGEAKGELVVPGT